MRNTMMAMTAVLVLSACGAGGTGTNTGAPAPPVGGTTREAGFAKGVVTDDKGQPLAGAKIIVGSTVFYNTNLFGTTNASGEYRVRLTSNDSWRVYGTVDKTYHGRTYTLDLHPEAYNTFATADGGIQNFVLKLAGEKAGGKHSSYGGAVLASPAAGDFETEAKYVEVSLTPTGPLIDGSEGESITAIVEPTPNGTGVFDVPIGQYSVTARYVVPGQAPVDLLVSREGQEQWANTYVGDFEPARSGASNTYEIRVDVKQP